MTGRGRTRARDPAWKSSLGPRAQPHDRASPRTAEGPRGRGAEVPSGLGRRTSSRQNHCRAVKHTGVARGRNTVQFSKFPSFHLEMPLVDNLQRFLPKQTFSCRGALHFLSSMATGDDGFKDFVLPSDFRHRRTHLRTSQLRADHSCLGVKANVLRPCVDPVYLGEKTKQRI